MAQLASSMPRELLQLRNPVGKILVGALWLMVLIVAALAWRAVNGREWIIGSGVMMASGASIAWWTSGPARLARLIVSVCLAGQVSLLMVAGHGTCLDGELAVLPFAALAALVAYADRGAVVTAGILLAAVQVIAGKTSPPAAGVLLSVSLMAGQIAGLGWLARKLRGFAVRAAHSRHAAASAHLILTSPRSIRAEAAGRFELALPAFAPAPGRGGNREWRMLLPARGNRTRMLAEATNASG